MNRNARTALILTLVALSMLGVSAASYKLYNLFCAETGAYGTTGQAAALPAATAARRVTVHFNAETQDGLPVTFKAVSEPATVKLGEPGHGLYHVRNDSVRAITIVARYNVTPATIGQYFEKVQCFCFEPHTLQPGEEQDLPVLFFVDPALDREATLKDISEITLSYTFYEQK